MKKRTAFLLALILSAAISVSPVPGDDAAGEYDYETESTEHSAGLIDISSIPAGDTIDLLQLSAAEVDACFQAYPIEEGDAVYERIEGRSFDPYGEIGLSDLRYLKVLHYNFDGEVQVGELIVNAYLAEDFLTAFKQLFSERYQIEKMHLIDDYWQGDGDSSDHASIDVNNTSAFCYRTTTSGSSLSNHAFGCAIDINPQQNPYIYGDGGVAHANAEAYVDRNSGLPHVITHEDTCYRIFTDLGFTWGGDWESVKDYQHFEKTF
ncbi:MAG: M15 family metallopeptidase [Lachnospiraceae bacterium]|nr:M15 family metallopeptidase [Lachnospiraceae bacterium]